MHAIPTEDGPPAPAQARPPAGPVLRGRHVDLRPLTVADAAVTLRWRQSGRARWLNRGAADEGAQARWIATRPADELNFAIVLKDGTAVGMLALTGIDHAAGSAEPGRFLIGEEARVRGIPAAVEAMALLYTHAFEDLGLVRLHGVVATGNTAMIKWQKYLGMREEGVLPGHVDLGGVRVDAVRLALSVDDWRRVARPRMAVLIAAGSRAGTGEKDMGKKDMGEGEPSC